MKYARASKLRNGQNRTATKKLIGGKQMSSKRVIRDGYPIPARNFSLQEIKDYFTYDSITCLMCGGDFIALRPSHLQRIHGVTVDQYKERYGLPYRKGLVSGEYSERQALRGKKLIEEGILKSTLEHRALAHQAIREGKMRRSAAQSAHASQNISGVRKPISKGIEDFREVLKTMVEKDCSANMAIDSRTKEGGSNERTWFYQFKRENEFAQIEFLETIDQLSDRTIVHASYAKYSPKIKQKVIELSKGHTNTHISQITGIGKPLIKEILKERYA